MTPGAKRALERLASAEDCDILCEENVCYVGSRQTTWNVVYELLRIIAIDDVSDSDKIKRYIISDNGRAVLRRPELEAELTEAFFTVPRRTFAVVNDRVVYEAKL